MASVSSTTSSLGNTSLRGYGGMASGIDRDAIIEQMTAGTNTKIWNQESAITKLEWKQEAYRGISDQLLDLYDNYCSYTSTTSLKDPNTFAKSLINILGKEDSTRFVTASGVSDLVGNVALQAVRQLASSSVRMSEKRQDKALTMALKELGGKVAAYSNLSGAQLNFVDADGKKIGSFEFSDSYEKDGVTHKIDYFPEDEDGYKDLAFALNELLQDKDPIVGSGDNVIHLKDAFKFEYKDGKMTLQKLGNGLGPYSIQGNSTALVGLGYKGDKSSDAKVGLEDLGNANNLEDFEKSVTTRINTIDYLRNEKLTFNYDGSAKDIMLITNEEANQLRNLELSDGQLMTFLGITKDELDKKIAEIRSNIRKAEEEGAIADAKEKIRNDVLKEINQEPESAEFTGWLEEKVKNEDDELKEKLKDDTLTDEEKTKLIGEAVKKIREEKGDAALLQEKLAQDATENGYGETQAETDLKNAYREEAKKELGLEGDGPFNEEEEKKISEIIAEKFGDEEQKKALIRTKQAEHEISRRIEEAEKKSVDDGNGGQISALDKAKKEALDIREAKQLEQKSMTARLTEGATLEQQDAISKALNKDRLSLIRNNIQNRLDKAYGTGNVIVGIDEENETLTFKTKKPDSSISVSSRDGGVLWTLGIESGESNKVNLSGTLSQSSLGINLAEKKKGADGKETDELVYGDGLVINGVKIGGIDANTSISSILSKINSSDAGVNATYVAATGQFMLVSKETGAGREITLDSKLARDLFGRSEVNTEDKISSIDSLTWEKDEASKTFTIGGKTITVEKENSISEVLDKINKAGITVQDSEGNSVSVNAAFDEETRSFVLKANGKDVTAGLLSEMSDEAKSFFTDRNDSYMVKGQDAIIDVSYGNGVTVSMERASNTFNLEGMTVTVSGVFGGEYVKGTDGKEEWKADTSAGVTFSAKADVDKVTEKVKKFFEDFNAIATEVNKQVTTRPDSSYGPLTDEQKDEMSETSIENWENKAKSGLLFNDSTMRDLSMDIQSVYTKLMSQTGLSYEDLKELGITYSDNEKDGGILVFDENAFRSAMENKPEKVSALFGGGSGMGNGLVKIVEDTFTPYATRYASRNGNSYGRLIEEAGSEKIPTSLMKNQIYQEIKSKQEQIEALRAQLQTEQDRYISMFTTMETMINKMNSQASYLSQITG